MTTLCAANSMSAPPIPGGCCFANRGGGGGGGGDGGCGGVFDGLVLVTLWYSPQIQLCRTCQQELLPH